MANRIKGFLDDSRSILGREADDVPEGVNVADWLAIVRFCAAIGDANSLYRDPAWGTTSRYHSMIAPPTFLASVRTPTAGAAYELKDYGIVKLLTGISFEWVDIVRIGDRLKSTLTVTQLREAHLPNGQEVAEVMSKATYRNSYGGLIATAGGVVSMVPYRRGEQLVEGREIHRYSDEEIARIERDIEGETERRGKLLRYWDDTATGEKLPALVKGPLSIHELLAWETAEAKPLAPGALTYSAIMSKSGRKDVNPTTNWPYWDAEESHLDILSCEGNGFKAPYSAGLLRACLAGQVITDWMGDDGFLRRLELTLPGHYLYGDTIWLNGTVADKYKVREGGEMYHAVDVGLQGVNQLSEVVARGTATVYLPAPGHPVTLPIPHDTP